MARKRQRDDEAEPPLSLEVEECANLTPKLHEWRWADSDQFDSHRLRVVPDVSKHSNSQREIEILSTCEHPNIIGLLGWSLQGSCYYLVLELMQYDLDNRLKSHLFGSWFFPCSERVAALRDVAAALKFLPGHTPCVYHRDVKSANVLLKDSLLGSSEDYETWNIS
ncbi:mnk-1 [Symbiodinium sp. CCMP2456]|nr:mnk-1 [Symbiodinium sp. CCMP2456]